MPPRAHPTPDAPGAVGQWRLELASLAFTFDEAALTLLGTSLELEGPTVTLQRFNETYWAAGNAQNLLQAVMRQMRRPDLAPETLSYRLRRRDGSEFEGEFTIASEVDAEGMVVAASGTLRAVPPPQVSDPEALVQLLPLAAGIAAEGPLRWQAVNPALAEWLGVSPGAHDALPLALENESGEQLASLEALDPHALLRLAGRPAQAHAARLIDADAWLLVLTDAQAQAQLPELRTRLNVAEADAADGRAFSAVGRLVISEDDLTADALWQGWLGGAASLEAWVQRTVVAADRAAVETSIEHARAGRSSEPLELRFLPEGGGLRHLRLWATPRAQGETVIWGLDISPLRSAELERSERLERERQLAAVLDRAQPSDRPHLVETIGALLGCSVVQLIDASGARLASWAQRPEWTGLPDALQDDSLKSIWATLRAEAPLAARYAQLDPRLAALVEPHLRPADVQSLLVITTDEGLILAEQREAARDWLELEVRAAQLLLAQFDHRQLNQTYARERTEAQDQLSQLRKLSEQGGTELSAAEARITELEKRAALTRAVEQLTLALNAPNAAIVGAGQTLRAALRQLLSADLPEAIVAALTAPSAPPSPATERQWRTEAAERLTDAGVVEAEAMAERVVELGLMGPLRADARALAEYLHSPEASARLEAAGRIGASLATAEAAAEQQLALIAGLHRSLQPSGASTRIVIDLGESVEAALAAYAPLQARGLRVEKRFERNPAVRANPDELMQVWLALLDHAVAGLPAAGLERGSIEVRLDEHDGAAELRIGDDGLALSAAEIDTAFAPGYGRQGGAPHGLDWCRRIVEAHTGALMLEALPTHTWAIVRLPLVSDSTSTEEEGAV